jgi:ubiquinone/menaquinone biosynthesis C-methylase UbiE
LNSPHITRILFDRMGPIYDALTANPLWRDSLREMARHFPPSGAALRLLDIGCGPGNSAVLLHELRPDTEIIGLDFAASILQIAQRRGITVAQAEATRLPLPESSVDAIIGHSVYYLIADRPAFLHDALRVLRPGGRLILLDPAKRGFPFSILRHIRTPKAALSLILWQTFARLNQRFTLEEAAEELRDAGFARILAELRVEGYGVLSRGEKPYPVRNTLERMQSTATRDDPVSLLPERGRFVFVLVHQSPDKPAWALRHGEPIRWDAAMLETENQPVLLLFTALPKAVAFMQPAVTSGFLQNINKVGKFDKTMVAHWGVDLLVNPSFEAVQGRYTLSEARLNVDPQVAILGDE